MADPPFVCPICQRASWHPRDRAERFCSTCGFVDDVLLERSLRGKPNGLCLPHCSSSTNIDWDLVPWRAAFRAASAARDEKLTALLQTLHAEAEARKG
jgi:hypothetical protein